jgi:hypothetical protein
MVIVKATKDSEAGVLPSTELLTEMGRFNEELVKAGVLLSAEGLQGSSHGVRVRFGGGQSTVIDGPFTESKELIAGFWLWQVKSIEEAIEWIRRSPFPQRERGGRDPSGVRSRRLRRQADTGAARAGGGAQSASRCKNLTPPIEQRSSASCIPVRICISRATAAKPSASTPKFSVAGSGSR